MVILYDNPVHESLIVKLEKIQYMCHSVSTGVIQGNVTRDSFQGSWT